MVVIGLGKNLLLKSVLGRCDYCKQAEEYTIHGIFCIVSNLLGYYFWRVVWSAYKEIKAETDKKVQCVTLLESPY